MGGREVYVIIDCKGNYVSDMAFIFARDEWVYVSFSGIATGFVWYKCHSDAKQSLNKVEHMNEKYKFGKGFKIGCSMLDEISLGEAMFESIIPC